MVDTGFKQIVTKQTLSQSELRDIGGCGQYQTALDFFKRKV